MNQRIEQLSSEAAEYADMYIEDDGTDAWMMYYRDKLAELVVQECMLAVSKTPVSEDELPTMVKCHDQIEKHFGV